MDEKDDLDNIISKARVHLYKPIQIAEILYRSRTVGDLEPGDLESYRTESRHWRDTVTKRLVGNKSTSSSRYQDNLFDKNAVPPESIEKLDEINKENNGIVENYIYHKCQKRWSLLIDIYGYIDDSDPETFDLRVLVDKFRDQSGLKKSLDKVYESVVHALFCTITRELGVMTKLVLENPNTEMVNDFSDFTNKVLGLPKGETEISSPAKLFRVGVSNAADRGVDIRTNFGPIVQVKHVGLDKGMAEDVVNNVAAKNVVIVCKTGEKALITEILSQMPFGDQIQGIITLKDLENWYEVCLSKYQDSMGDDLLNDLQREINREFPQVTETQKFMAERGYNTEELTGIWKVWDDKKVADYT